MVDVRAERRGDVAWLVLDHPERLNAYDRAMGDELRRLVDASVDAGVIVITGSGRGFCAGGYLAELANPDEDELRQLFRCSLELFEAIRTSPRPVIAAVNGVAMGGGFEMALACDIIVAAGNAVFALPEVRVGLIAAGGGVHRLPRMIPRKQAMGMILTGRRVSAQEGKELGFVNEVVPIGAALQAARRWADMILECSPMAVRASKEAVYRGLNEASLEQAVRTFYPAQKANLESQDYIEGPKAFAEKRKPNWQNK